MLRGSDARTERQQQQGDEGGWSCWLGKWGVGWGGGWVEWQARGDGAAAAKREPCEAMQEQER